MSPARTLLSNALLSPWPETDLLSWDSPRLPRQRRSCDRHRASAAPGTPPSTCSPASTPGPVSPPPLRPLEDHSRSRVPTSWFCTTAPVCSADRPVAGTAALSAPKRVPSWESRDVPASLPIGVRRVSGQPPGLITRRCAIPATRTPLEERSPSAAVPRHRGPSPPGVVLPRALDLPSLPLPVPTLSRIFAIRSPPGSCSTDGSVPPAALCRRADGLSFLGFPSSTPTRCGSCRAHSRAPDPSSARAATEVAASGFQPARCRCG